MAKLDKLNEQLKKTKQLNEEIFGENEEEELGRVRNAVTFAGGTPGTPEFERQVRRILRKRKSSPSVYDKIVNMD